MLHAENETVDLAIIGAGAAGITAAIFAAESLREQDRGDARIVVLEGARRVGAKILISGGGHCNVTNDVVRVEDFNSSGSTHIVRNVLRAFDEHATVAWFDSLGVPLVREDETGKLFPASNQARTVLGALLRRCEELGVRILADHRAEAISRGEAGYRIQYSHGELTAARVILATGGRSIPKTGSDGHGWDIARSLGHAVTPTYPALSPLRLDPAFFHARLSGISHEAELTTLVDGRPIDRRRGALLWTHFGCSGPVVLDASRFWIIAQAEGRHPELRCNFLIADHKAGDGNAGTTSLDRWLVDAAAREPRRGVARVLAEAVPQRLAEEVCALAGVPPDLPMAQLVKEARNQLVRCLTELPLPVIGDRGWNYAEVTAGGVPLAEIDYRTMESRRSPGLFLCGEMLDCEGRIGGFNFQWAWSTGHVAGRAAARSLMRPALTPNPEPPAP